MSRFVIYVLFLAVAVSAAAQANVTGNVIEKESNEPIVGASVIVKGADGKIKKFASSKSDGGFSITHAVGKRLPSGSCHNGFRQAVYSS